jgi:hypothetical protein
LYTFIEFGQYSISNFQGDSISQTLALEIWKRATLMFQISLSSFLIHLKFRSHVLSVQLQGKLIFSRDYPRKKTLHQMSFGSLTGLKCLNYFYYLNE